MPEWISNDPRQVETYRLLQLIGGEPAAYFLDACRLMDGDLKLEATTHVVGHLLRELDGSLSGVLRPMVPADRWPEPNTENAQRRKIDAVCAALRVPADDDFREAWRNYAGGLHSRAHRHGLAAPRPVDARFRDLWEQGQTVIYLLAGRIEANFIATLPLIDRLAAGEPDLGTFRHQVPHSTVALDRFFDQAGVAWLEPLRQAGYFNDPPPLVYNDDGSVSYPRWPQGRYLARVAAEAPETVITLGVDLATDNPEAQESFVDAACAVSAAEAARLVPTVEQWLDTPAQWALPLKVRDLVAHLVRGGEVDRGLSLLRALITNPRVGQDRYLAGELVSELTPGIFPAASIAGLKLLVDMLAERVAADSHGEHDHSSIWRPHLEAGRRGDLRDQLVTAVRDAAEALLATDEGRVADVVATLEARNFSIFRRLALDLIARHPDVKLVAARLTDHDLFDDPGYEREYTALARDRFRELEPDARATILGWIEAAPGYAGDEQSRRRWQRRMLERLGRPLPGEWEARYRELAGEAAPEPERVPEIGFVGPRSPLGQAELAAMPVAETVALLREWEPEDDWRAPTPEGLGRVLRQVVVADPERFAAEAMAFLDVDPTYVRALLGGLREARQNRATFPWPAVLDLANAILDKPRKLAGRDPRAMELDPGWTWTWQESLHLIREGLQDGAGQIGKEHKDLVWNVLARHADDANPAPEDEQDGDGFGPAMLALNSIRGTAMHAAFHYGWWLRGDDPERRLPAELAALLERRLDPRVEQTAAIRSVYGQWFPQLITCDEAWAQAHADVIFPREGDERLWRAAWHAYLRSNRASENVYRVLAAQYRRGIEELASPGGDDGLLGEVGEALATHLMSLYAQGLIAFGDEGGLLDRFYEVASVERRAEALESIGRGVMDGAALSEVVAARLRALLERRLEAVRAGGDGEELRGYAWWFASGKFDAAWSLAQLRALLQAGGRVHPDHLVAGRLAALRGEHLLEVVRTLELLIETGTRPWFVLAARDDITAILTDALATGGEAETRARDIINRLVARGFGDFGGLLPS